jgi:hypothetical protein
VPALTSMLAEFAVIESLATELRTRGVTEPEAMSASHEISRLIRIARQSTAVRGNLSAAKAFIDTIAVDPLAEIPDPGDPIVEHLEPRIEKPMIDGSQFLNRGDNGDNGDNGSPQPVEDAMPNPAIDPDGAWRHMHPDPIWAPTFMPAPRS